MGKVIEWVLGFTKIGKASESVQGWLSGKKTYIVGGVGAISAIATIVTKYSDQGPSYLLHVAGTPEWDTLLLSLGMMGLRAGVSKAAIPPVQ